ncbi:hypothetical protein [Polymorphobacter megasporae]|nr:hypothetical protein [Polymorphobacter megasporae]UAJ09436.1 hypothetical protein KTC28_14115 [Polymorphobacter megasporae]
MPKPDLIVVRDAQATSTKAAAVVFVGAGFVAARALLLATRGQGLAV